jgi:hypothetical protein
MLNTNFLRISTNAANGFSQVNILIALIPLIILLSIRIRLSVFAAMIFLVEQIFFKTNAKTQMFSIMQKSSIVLTVYNYAQNWYHHSANSIVTVCHN